METKTGLSNCFSDSQINKIKRFVRKRKNKEIKEKQKVKELERKILKLLSESVYTLYIQVLYCVI